MLNLLLEAAQNSAAAANTQGEALAATPFSGAAFNGIAFLFLAVVVVYSAFLVMTQKDIVRAATALFISLSGVAGLYLLLGAEFLAFAQIIVYVGGTTILIMFGVMLTARSPVEITRKGENRALRAIFVVALVAVPLITIFLGLQVHWHGGAAPRDAIAPQDTRNLGDMLLTSYIAPFVIASFVLLIALVGAAYLVRRREEPADAEPNEELA